MAQLKSFFKRIVLMVIIISIIISACAVPNSYAKLTIGEGEFYYAGTTKGSYKPSDGIFSWALNLLKEIASFLINLIPNAVRMAFVGYTALAEKVLTWALESTAGVNLSGEDVSATDLSKLTDSTNNVTVQAIVYNMVPALNVNFFDTEYKDMYRRTIKERDADGNIVEKEVIISPTGQQLICKKCGKSVLECCGEWNDSKKEIRCYGTSSEETAAKDCGCKGCDACQKYAQLMLAQDPIVIQLKKLIAVWYYIIRLLAVAAMCVVLIFIGIKMAISTVASDKAVYKRMLVDWAAGLILIFTMHYFMYFGIYITDTLVNTVRESANQINKVSMMQLADTSKNNGNSEVEVSNQDLEIDVYEEIRTRAYDTKLTIGLMGMLMYITLVFMAFKYTLIYIKRFLTLAVLTLMAPGLGVAYAMQKVMSGKSSSLKSWLSEYLLNLLIQVVHALMYAIFISAALKYSLENISGVLIALILMNFSLKGEAMFRRIFNLDPGNKGLLGATETAGDRDKLAKNFKTMKGMAIGAKPLAKAITAPGRIAMGGAAKATAAGVLIGGSKVKDMFSSKGENKSSSVGTSREAGGSAGTSSQGSQGDSNGNAGGTSGNSGTVNDPLNIAGARATASDRQSLPKLSHHKEDKELLKIGEADLEKELAKSIAEYKEDPKDSLKYNKVLEDNRRLERFRKISAKKAEDLSVGGVAVGHISNAFDINNYFDISIDSNGNKRQKLKKGAIFGSYKYDPKTGRYVKDNSNAAYTQFGAAKLLGFSDKDKKIFKDQVWKPAVKGVGGLASMFLGMGNLVAHPVIGMGAIAGGAGLTGSMLKRFKRPTSGSPGRLKCLKLGKGENQRFPGMRFKFGSFETPTLVHMRDSIVAEANKELSENMIRYMNRTRPEFLKKLGKGEVAVKTLGLVAGVGIAPVAVGVHSLRKNKQDPLNRKFKDINNPYQIGTRKEVMDAEKLRLYPIGNSAWDIVDRQHFEQVSEQKKTFIDEANALINQREISDAKVKMEQIKQNIDKKVDESDLKEYNKMLVEIWAARGFEFDPETGKRTAIVDVEKDDIKPKIKVENVDSSVNTVTENKNITEKDINTLNKRLDEIITKRLDGRQIDVNNEKVMTEIIKELSDQLAVDGIIGKNQSADVLFEHGVGKLKTTIKSKATQANAVIKESEAYELNTKEYDAVQQAILDVAKESAASDGSIDLSQIDQNKVLAKVQQSLKSQNGQIQEPQGKKKQKGDLSSKLDSKIDQISEAEKYQNAISTLLNTDSAAQNVINNNLTMNINDPDAKNRMGSMLGSQNQLNTAIIRNRVLSSDGTISRNVKNVSDNENRKLLKKNLKKQISEVVEKYSKDVVEVKEGDKTKKIVSREEKLKQAEQATAGLDEISRDAVLNSLFVITGMEENIKALNRYSDETLVESSKYKKKTNKNYAGHLQAQIEKSEAKIILDTVKQEDLATPDSDTDKKSKIAARIDEATKNLEIAEEKFSRTGPVQNVRKATNEVLELLKQKRD